MLMMIETVDECVRRQREAEEKRMEAKIFRARLEGSFSLFLGGEEATSCDVMHVPKSGFVFSNSVQISTSTGAECEDKQRLSRKESSPLKHGSS